MFSHATLGISDFGRAMGFWAPLMALLGHRLRFQDAGQAWAAWEPATGGRPLFVITTPFDGAEPSPGNGAMLAFTAADEDMVRRAHALGLAHGGADAGAPGLRPWYHPRYFGAYLRDPDGNKLCIVCHEATETDAIPDR